jgi:hypothetical protein
MMDNKNYNEDILQERDFGSDPNGNMFGQGGNPSVMNTNVPLDCCHEHPTLGIETSIGNDPSGEMFGMPAPDKDSLISGSSSWPSISEVEEERSFSSLTLQHTPEEGTRGEI